MAIKKVKKTNSRVVEISRHAKQIRTPGESWQDALSRATKELQTGTKAVKKS